MNDQVKGKFKVLFVCTGNTCRSPMGEAILKKLLEEKGAGSLEISSAGTYALPNAPASLFAMEVASKRNVDLSRHRSRQLTAELIRQADLVLAMSQEHLDSITRSDRTAGCKTFLLKVFPRAHPESNKGGNGGVLSIEDPIGGSLDDYEHSFTEIEKEMERILPELLSLAQEGEPPDTSKP